MKTSSINNTILTAVLSTLASQAAVITYDFDGAVSGGMPHPTLLGTNVHPGATPFVGHFSYDSFAPQVGSTATSATYPLIDLHLTFNPSTLPETVILTGGFIAVVDDPTFGDRWEINGGLGQPPTTVNTGGFNLDFHGISLFYDNIAGSIFNNTDLPGANLTEADFPPSGSYVFSYSEVSDNFPFNADGNLDNLNSTTIPEPSGSAFLLGSLTLGLLRRNRS